MALKKLISIGFELPSDEIQYCNFKSNLSLLDFDIVLFKPSIESYLDFYETYQGKPSLSDSDSFLLKDQCAHWNREIKEAFDSGKTIIIFLSELKEVYIDTGQRTYSGTGRNQKTTRIVSLLSNYSAIPINLKPKNKVGSAIKIGNLQSDIISVYWQNFGTQSQYKVVITVEKKHVCLMTENGDIPVGAIIRNENSNGSIVCLPDIDFEVDTFLIQKEDGQYWTQAARKFANRMVSTIVSLDKVLHNTGEITPEPHWVADRRYTFKKELELNQDLLKVEAQIEKERKIKETLLEKLKQTCRFRSLLYEKGKPLEKEIINALLILGFKAETFRDSNSEFDVVFESEEGRLLGEAEGKDNKAINVDKLRQLSMNIHEDLQRKEVQKPAKGVLFGNAFRLSPPSERDIPFTEKCINGAISSSTALLATSELFFVVQYLLNFPDANYAKLCRTTILESIGIVTFPKPPKKFAKIKEELKIGEDN